MKRLLLLLLLLFGSLNIFGIKNRFSETFLYTRPCYERLNAYEAFWQNMTFYQDCFPHSNMQFLFYYQNSINKRDDQFRQYFLMRDKNVLTVKGDDINKFDRDIRAEWLQLSAGYNGEFSMLPEQEQVGAMFVARRDIKGMLNWDFLDNFWVGAQVPIALVKNKINFSETSTNSPTILSKLSSQDYLYNRIIQCTDSVGITELELMAGAHFQPANDLQIGTRTGFIVPLGNKYSGKVFYEAIRGYNRHLAWETTLNLQFPLNCSDICKVSFYADFQTILLFTNHQRRTFDLVNRPYSRYLLFNSTTGQTNIPGVNVLTPEVKVKPFNLVDICSGFRVRKGNLEIQIAYNLWAHGNEEVELKYPWQPYYGIAAAPGDVTPSGLPATASESTIKTLAPTDQDCEGQNTFVPVLEQDLDYRSAISRGTFTNGVGIAAGWVHNHERVCGFIGAGAFIDFPMNNAALQIWGAWFKIGASM